MNKAMKGTGIGFYSRLIAAVTAVLALVVYLVYNLAIHKLTVDVLVAILVGAAVACFAVVNDFKFAPIVSVLGVSLGIGLYLNDRIIMFEEMINHIVGMTERNNIFAVVMVIFALLFLSAICGIIASFTERKVSK